MSKQPASSQKKIGAIPTTDVPHFVTVIPASVEIDKYGNRVPYHEMVKIKAKDFGWLKKLPYNRDILQSMVEKLTQSVIDFGLLRVIVLVKYKYEYWRADGGHLVESADKSRLPLYAFIVPIEDDDEIKIMKLIVAMNNTARRWSLTQYAKNWMNFWGKKSEAYKRLNEMKKAYHISFSLLGSLMYKGTQSEAKNAIRMGTFIERAAPSRIDRLLSAMENFNAHTKVNIHHTHTAAGLAKFIILTELDAYLLKETAFINAVKKYQKKNRIPVFARESDSFELWADIYSKLR